MRECTWIRCPCSGEEDVLFEVGDVVSIIDSARRGGWGLGS